MLVELMRRLMRPDRAKRLAVQFAQATAGGLAVSFAVSLPVLLVILGTASDYAVMTKLRAELQEAADAAAMAGAREIPMANADPEQVENAARTFAVYRLTGDATTSAEKLAALALSVDVEVAKDLSVVDVTIKENWSPFFAHFVSKKVTPVRVNAAARFVGRNNICVMGLAKYKTAIDIDHDGRLTGNDCGVFSNSGDSNSLRIAHGAVVKASIICTAGGSSVSGSANVSPKVVTDCPVVDDPLANRPPPKVGSCSHKSLVIDSQVVSLDPGVYCGGITIKGTARVTFNAGVYVINDGGLVVMNNGSIEGTGVGFYMTGKGSGIKFASGTRISLAAPKDGPMAGLLFFEDRKMTGTIHNRITSNDARTLLGTLYLPVGSLMIDAKQPVADQSAYTAIVGKSIELRSGPNLVLNSNYDMTDVPVPAGIAGSSQVILSQ